MQITSPEDRAIVWARTSAVRGEERESMLRFLASDFLVELRSEFDLYSGHEDQFVDSVFLLDYSGRLLDREMLSAYQAVAIDDEGGSRFFASFVVRLSSVASDEGLEPRVRERAAGLASRWREVILDKEDATMLKVAEVASRFDVTPQAVYEWIRRGKIEFEETPGGSYRIPAAQFRTSRDDHARFLDLERRLYAVRGDVPPPTEDELVEEIRSRRGT